MKTTINTNKELKDFVSKNRKNIKKINGVQFGEMYPMMDITNKHASYYDVESQEHKLLYAPFIILMPKKEKTNTIKTKKTKNHESKF